MEKSQLELHADMWKEVTASLIKSHGNPSAEAAEEFTNCTYKISKLMAKVQKNPKAYEELLTLKRDKPTSGSYIKLLQNNPSYESFAAIEEVALRPFVRAARCDKFKSPLVKGVADAICDCYDAIGRLQEALGEKKKFLAMEEKFQKGLRKSNPEISAKKASKRGAK